MKKLIVLFLSATLMVAVSCSSDFNPSMSRGYSGGGYTSTDDSIPPDVIPPNDNTTTDPIPPDDNIITDPILPDDNVTTDPVLTNENLPSTPESKLAAFINKYAGLYYGVGMAEAGIKGQVVHYKLKDGKIWEINGYNQATDILQHPTIAVILSDTQLLIDNYMKGTKEILHFNSKGLDAYINFLLDKVSDTPDTKGMYSIGVANGYGKYAGTYRSQYEKKDKYLSITKDGTVYFHENLGSGKLFPGNDGIQLLIIDSKGVRNTMIFNGSIYRKFTLKNNTITNISYPIVCEVTKDFIEDINGGQHATYISDDGKNSMTINEPFGSSGIVKMTGSVCIGGIRKDGRTPWSDMIAHITILKGKTLHIGGSYNTTMTFNNDWSTLTYNGKVLRRQDTKIEDRSIKIWGR